MRKNAEARVKTWNVQKLEATVAQEQEVFSVQARGTAKAN
jgi:hypothetical protein